MIIDYEEFGEGDFDMTECAHNPNLLHQVYIFYFYLFKIPDELIMDEEDVIEQGFAPLYCLPLYSLLPPEKQRLVFETVPTGSRLFYLSLKNKF